MRRALQSLVVVSATPVVLALPVLPRALPKPHAVPPKVHEVALRGIDRAAAGRIAGWGTTTYGPATSRPLALTAESRAASFSALGVTWAEDGAGEVEVLARVRQQNAWTPWHALDGDGEHEPDVTSVEAHAPNLRGGTTPWFTGPADAYQVRVGALGSHAPHDVRVSLVDPGTSAADAAMSASPTLGHSAADASIGRPSYITRAQWGADERLRSGTPSYGDTIKTGFVHHTDSTNSYTTSQAAALVRSVYAFHTQSRGWSDIGYNFLVDKYGRVFEGRYGGVDRPVIGAHTGGFNTDTFGVSLLGTYTSVAPTGGQLTALEKVFAWKLGLHYVNPYARTTLTSAGGTKYAKGVRVTFNNVSGHRDAGLTSCPGNQVYNRLPTIRGAIKTYMGASLYYPSVSATSALYKTTPTVTIRSAVATGSSWRLTVRNARSGAVKRIVTGQGTSITATWNLRDSAGLLVPPDTYSMTLEAWNSTSKARLYSVVVKVRSPLPSGIVIAHDDGLPYAMVENGSIVGVSPALGSALRPQPALVTAYGSRAELPGAQAPPRDGMYVKASSGALYLTVDGLRRPVSGSAASALGLTSPRLLPNAVLGALPVGPAWTDTTRHPDGQVVLSSDNVAWRIESGVRRPFTSHTARGAWARGWVAPRATAADLALPLGAPLPPAEGIVLRTDTGAVIVSGGTYRTLSNAAALGWNAAAAPLASPDDLAALPLGEPVGVTAHPPGTLLRNGSGYLEILGTGKRIVDPALLPSDPRLAVAPETGELAALGGARWLPPSGIAGRALDGTVRVVENGRLVTLPGNVANALGYASATLPALEASDFGPLPLGPALVNAAAHPAGTLVTDGTTTWLLDASRRRVVAPSLIATWLGHPVLPATAADLALPTGTPAPPQDGAWVRTPDGTTWLVYGGARRSTTLTVARRLGFDLVPPVPVVAAELAAGTSLGSPVP